MTQKTNINWKYALGEIIIVILGISIAFSLNRWAENAKDKSIKRQYLESLVVDLDSEIQHLEENIQAFQQKIKDARLIMPYFYGKQEGRDTITNKIFLLSQVIPFKAKDVTYKTLINSGDLSLFSDFELKRSLENYYSSYESIRLNYQRQNHINEKYFADFMIYHMEYDKTMQGDYSFIDNKLLKNIIQSLYGSYTFAIQSSKEGIERSKDIKKLIEEKLSTL